MLTDIRTEAAASREAAEEQMQELRDLLARVR